VRRRTVLRAFVAAAGGPGCRIAVVPSASSLSPEVVDVYRTVFTALGAADVVPLRPTSRAESADRQAMAEGARCKQVEVVLDELDSTRHAMARSNPGDLVVISPDQNGQESRSEGLSASLA
jgi:hydrogenase maturation factor